MDNFCDHIDSLNGLDSRLDQSGAFGIVAELVNEFLDVSDFIHLTLAGTLRIAVLLGLGRLELLEVTTVVGEALRLEVHDLIDCSVEEVTGVRHDNDCGVYQLLNVVL